jgi:hypothetical protein
MLCVLHCPKAALSNPGRRPAVPTDTKWFPIKCRDVAVDYAATAAFHILSGSFCEAVTAGRKKIFIVNAQRTIITMFYI